MPCRGGGSDTERERSHEQGWGGGAGVRGPNAAAITWADGSSFVGGFLGVEILLGGIGEIPVEPIRTAPLKS